MTFPTSGASKPNWRKAAGHRRLPENLRSAQISDDRSRPVAYRHREPFCAVIIEPSSGEVLATGINFSRVDPTQHSEMAALRDLISRHPKKGRSALALYTTAELSPMCAAAIVWCDFGDVVYGIRRTELVKLGWDDFTTRAKALLDDAMSQGRYSREISKFSPVLRRQCVSLFERFRKR